MMIPFNINDNVLVKLTDHGRAIHRADHKNFWDSVGQANRPYHPPKADAEGWSKFQMWELMRIFGPEMTVSSPLSFETSILFNRPETVNEADKPTVVNGEDCR